MTRTNTSTRTASIFICTVIGAGAVALVGCNDFLGVSDKNCSDFVCQADAQAWHDANLGSSDLDRDNDGIACEALPSCASMPPPALPPPVIVQQGANAQHSADRSDFKARDAAEMPGLPRGRYQCRIVGSELTIEIAIHRPCDSESAAVHGFVRIGPGGPARTILDSQSVGSIVQLQVSATADSEPLTIWIDKSTWAGSFVGDETGEFLVVGVSPIGNDFATCGNLSRR